MNGRAVWRAHCFEGNSFGASTRPAGAPGFCDDSAVRVRRADINRVNGRAVGASIFVRVTKGLSLCHIAINVMKVWRNELKTSVNVINVTFYLG